MAQLFDLDRLKTLVTIAETGSLSSAAPRLCRSQSAISEQIRKLEEMCGRPLLVRGKTGASLTPAGKRLVAHARELLALSDVAYRDMQGARLAGDLRLAITDYFRPQALPVILRRLRERFPRLRMHVSIRKSARIEEEAAAGSFDIGLSMTLLTGDRSSTHASEDYIRLRREPLLWVADRSFRAPEPDILPLVVLPDTCSLQRFIVKTLDAHAVPYAIGHSASGIGGLHLALAAGLGIACLNASAVPEGAVPLTGNPRLPPLPEVEFCLVPSRPDAPSVILEARAMLAEHLA
ncbi:LysR substrate-binding domain-containing protein [Methylobacterium sp. J-048]|uniref:LysR substrate-binding domain-containing protein n=1 Tax=Methylobacterium sp. J-048 TaxID=2836635 RepID=UPI001FBA738E|nr:LysR substrate-binding domain-containing protein [Methylobacterium sp. J-048]MCJ2055429.1 LysR substrate-binding domain-containing protein [Methylobacterium sp. J-048]